MTLGLDDRPHGAKRREFEKRQAIVEGVHRRGRAAPFLRLVPRVLVSEYPDFVERLAVGLRPLEHQPHRRDVVRHLELAVCELGHPGAVGHRAVNPELHADHALDGEQLVAAHADRFGDLPNVLADAGARNLVERLTVATVLPEARVVRLRAVPAGRTCGWRTRRSGTHSATAAALLCDQRTAGKQHCNTQREHFAHVQTSEIVQASVYNWIRRMPQEPSPRVALRRPGPARTICTYETDRRQVPY